MSADLPGQRWTVPDPASLRCKHWGDEVVVYDSAQAATHLLAPLAGSVLLHMLTQSGAVDVAQLQGAIFEPEAQADLHADMALLHTTLADLRELGLAAPQAP